MLETLQHFYRKEGEEFWVMSTVGISIFQGCKEEEQVSGSYRKKRGVSEKNLHFGGSSSDWVEDDFGNV